MVCASQSHSSPSSTAIEVEVEVVDMNINMNMNMNIDDNNNIDENKAGSGSIHHHNSTARRSLRIRNLSTRPSYAEVEEGIDDDDAESIANGNANANANGNANGNASDNDDVDDDDDVDSSESRQQRPHPQVHRRSKRARIDGNGNGNGNGGDDASFSTEVEIEVEADSEVDTQRTTQTHTNTNMNMHTNITMNEHTTNRKMDVNTNINMEMEMADLNFKMPIDDLCGGIIQNIYSYLDDSRDLYNFSQCSKWLSSLVKYEHVVQVAVFENKKSYQYKKIIDRVEHALDKNSIYVPSVHRLLRLVNGVRCERGSECWGHNLLTGSVPRVTNFGDFGLCLCYVCAEGITSKWKHDWRSTWLKSQLEEVNFMKNCHETCDTLVTEVGTGKPVGPYCCTREIKQMTETFQENKPGVSRSDAANEEEIQQFEQERDALLRARIEERLNTDENLAQRESLLQLIRKTKLLSSMYNERRRQELLEAEKSKYHKKVEILQEAHESLSNILFRNDPSNREVALEHTVNPYHRTPHQPIVYKCFYVKEVMRSIINRPAFATRRNITKKARMIERFFENLSNSNFLSFEFLHGTGTGTGTDDSNDDHDDIDNDNNNNNNDQTEDYIKAVRRYAKTHLSERDVLHCNFSQPLRFARLITSGNLMEAFVYMMIQNISTIGIEAFSYNIEPIDHDIFSEEDSRAYAIRFWKNAMSSRFSYLSRQLTMGDDTLDDLSSHYDSFMDSFNDQKQRVVRFLNRETTRAYLAADDEHDHPGHGFTRTAMLLKTFLNHYSNTEALFMEVHEEYYFENPEDWAAAE